MIDGYASYLGEAAGLALAATALLGLLGPAAGLRPGPRGLATLLAALFFVALTQHPLPDPGSHLCPGPAPNLRPFRFVDRMVRMWLQYRDLRPWLVTSGIADVGMNVLACAAIGALLSLYRIRRRDVVALVLALSLAVELTQLTGLWGLYPCPYRSFDLDDLLLNALGGALGAALARRLRPRPP